MVRVPFRLGLYISCPLSRDFLQELWPEAHFFDNLDDFHHSWINRDISARGTWTHHLVVETWSQTLQFALPMSAYVFTQTLKDLAQKPLAVFDNHGLCELSLHDPLGTRLTLTSKERDVLYLLMTEEKVHRDYLLEQVWQLDDSFITHTLESHMSSIRQKLVKELSNPFTITCHNGEYRLVPSTDS